MHVIYQLSCAHHYLVNICPLSFHVIIDVPCSHVHHGPQIDKTYNEEWWVYLLFFVDTNILMNDAILFDRICTMPSLVYLMDLEHQNQGNLEKLGTNIYDGLLLYILCTKFIYEYPFPS